MSYNEKLRCDDLTTNHEGATAWHMTPEWELYTTVVTTMGTEDKFYESGEDRVRRIADLVRKVEPVFVAQLAIYTRETMHLRSVPLLLLVELARCHHGDNLVSKVVSCTVQRADEIAELLMCYQWRMGKKDLTGLSSQLRKGLAESFNHFDEYQFAKYNRTDRKVTLRDALLLVHPKPKDERQAEIFRKILNDKLETPYTWETELSSLGKQRFSSIQAKDDAKRETWQDLIASGRLGYMAMLRNLRNMTNLCIDDNSRSKVCQVLSDADAVKQSRQLPFRFFSAYLQLVRDDMPACQTYQLWNSFYTRCYNDWAIMSYSTLDRYRMAIISEMSALEKGEFWVWERKGIRHNIQCLLLNNAVFVGKEAWKVPKIHHSRWRKCMRHFDVLRPRDQKRLQRLSRILEGIEKKMSKLEPIRAKQELVIDKARSEVRKKEERMLKAYECRVKDFRSELRRRDTYLSQAGLSKKQYIAPFLWALEQAVRHSADNIPGFDENTRVLIASDTSGSMMRSVSQNSSVQCYHIGLLLSMLMKHRCKNAVTGMFGDIWKVYPMPSVNILQNTLDMMKHEGEVGYSTNGHKVIEWLIANDRVMDKVMLFTDCQLWNSEWGDANLSHSWNRYKKMAPQAKLYLFDLAGYGQSPISMVRDDVFCIAGWSDKVFDILAALERGNSAIDEIRRIII